MVRHIVSWNFKPELSEEERQAAREALVPRLNALQELVPCAPGPKPPVRPWTAATAIWCCTPRWPRPLICLCTRTTRSTRRWSP